MTIRERCEKYLESRGLSRYEARVVMDHCVLRPELNAMLDRWGDDEAEYIPQLLTPILTSVQIGAAEWLRENIPNHWALKLLDLDPAPARAPKGGANAG